MPFRFHLDIDRLLAILQYLTILLFVAGGVPLLSNRARLRRAAIVVYLAALALVLAYVAVWLVSRR